MNKKGEKAILREEVLEELGNINFRRPKTFGQKSADWITKWAGSWYFILGFFVFLAIWISINVLMWIKQWDP